MLALKCCVCHDMMTLEPNALEWCATSCGHMFHYLCLTQWRERSETCPQCCRPVKSGQMFRLYPPASEEKPKDDISEVLQTCLDSTQTQLEEMTDLCMNKDGVIASLKVNADNDMNFRRENEALKSMLLTFNSESLDSIFDDPNHFDEVLMGKIALMKLDEAQKQGENPDVPKPKTEASNAVGSSTKPKSKETAKPKENSGASGSSASVTSQGRRESDLSDGWPELRPIPLLPPFSWRS